MIIHIPKHANMLENAYRQDRLGEKKIAEDSHSSSEEHLNSLLAPTSRKGGTPQLLPQRKARRRLFFSSQLATFDASTDTSAAFLPNLARKTHAPL
eukprot:3316305-Pleurochrysis_carterae.AAC.2